MTTGIRRIVPLVAAAVFCVQSPATAQDDAGARARALAKEIDALVERIDADRGRRDALYEALEATEREIRVLAGERDALGERIESVSRRIAELDRLSESAGSRLPLLRAQLGDALRARQRLSRGARASILFSEEDPARVQRMLTYFDYLFAAQGRRIDALREEIEELLGARESLAAEHATLAQLQRDHQEKAAALETSKRERAAQVAALAERIDDAAARLAAKRQEQARLERLLDGIGRIRERAARQPEAAGVAAPAEVAARRGRLKLPAAGDITTRFRQPDPFSGVPASGIVISTGDDADVRSISAGQVVYSDWFRGFGLLLVLDHGDGFMSLYGYNSDLLYPVGATVAEDVPIARAGNTSGRSRTGVYFELRRHGEAVDPLEWCEPRDG